MERRSSYKTGARIRRTDANQKDIVKALRGAFASVQSIHIIGKGVPDLLVGYKGQNLLLEVKSGEGKLTPDEIEWQAQWRGQVATVRTIEEALALLGIS